jgi:hypothetical protein
MRVSFEEFLWDKKLRESIQLDRSKLRIPKISAQISRQTKYQLGVEKQCLA